MKFPSIFLLLFSLLGLHTALAQTAEEAAIIKVCQEETRAFLANNPDGQKPYHKTAPYNRLLLSLLDGTVGVNGGDRATPDALPPPTWPTGMTLTTSNHNVHVNGNMAFITYDQAFGFPDGNTMHLHNLTVLEKESGKWLIVAAAVIQDKPK